MICENGKVLQYIFAPLSQLYTTAKNLFLPQTFRLKKLKICCHFWLPLNVLKSAKDLPFQLNLTLCYKENDFFKRKTKIVFWSQKKIVQSSLTLSLSLSLFPSHSISLFPFSEVNFTNIIRAHLSAIFFWQKRTSLNWRCKNWIT